MSKRRHHLGAIQKRSADEFFIVAQALGFSAVCKTYQGRLLMQCVRFGAISKEKPGIIDSDGNIRDISSLIPDFTEEYLDPVFLDSLESLDLSQFNIVKKPVRLGSCVAHPSKIICIGLNYKDHILATNAATPKEPILFAKMCKPTGPFDPIVLPKNSKKTDWEIELAVVIGKKAHYIRQENAPDYIAGYCVIDDLSEREFQLEREGQWTKGKSCEGFAPLGPFLVTQQSVKNVQNLSMWAEVNGERFQNSNTNQMLFSVNELVSYISQFMPLYPGDVISTGTPPGVGNSMKPNPIFIKAGDCVKVGIEGLGEQEHIFLAYKE
jgi:2,4-diketo-3-deoxy-L-fuconate hydrolase